MAIAIRAALLEDLDRLMGVVRAAARRLDERGVPQWDEVYPSAAILRVDVERRQLWVVEVDEVVAGLVTLNEDQPAEYAAVPWRYPGRVLVVHRLAVDPPQQGRGLAARLMGFAEAEAAARGYDTIRLDAFLRNPVALALYAGRGYRRAGTVSFRKGEFACFERRVAGPGDRRPPPRAGGAAAVSRASTARLRGGRRRA